MNQDRLMDDIFGKNQNIISKKITFKKALSELLPIFCKNIGINVHYNRVFIPPEKRKSIYKNLISKNLITEILTNDSGYGRRKDFVDSKYGHSAGSYVMFLNRDIAKEFFTEAGFLNLDGTEPQS